MKTNKILTILTFFLLFSCGFEPIYSQKKLDSNYNFTINNIGFSGNNNINQYLKNDLIKYQNNKNKEKTLIFVFCGAKIFKSYKKYTYDLDEKKKHCYGGHSSDEGYLADRPFL